MSCVRHNFVKKCTNRVQVRPVVSCLIHKYMSHVQVRPVVSCLVHKIIAYVRPVVSCVWQREQTVHVELHTWSTWINPIFQENYHRAVIKEYLPARILKCPEHFQWDISQHHIRQISDVPIKYKSRLKLSLAFPDQYSLL